MLGDAADKFAHLEREIDDCLYVLDALWDKQCNKIVMQKWAEILARNKRVTGASSEESSADDEFGVIVHDDKPHPESMTFEEPMQ